MCATFAKRAVIPNGVRDLSQTQKITLGKLCDQSFDCEIARPAMAGLGMTNVVRARVLTRQPDATSTLLHTQLFFELLFALVQRLQSQLPAMQLNGELINIAGDFSAL